MQLLARTPSASVNYANELIREAERADKTKTAPSIADRFCWSSDLRSIMHVVTFIFSLCVSVWALGTARSKHPPEERLVSLW